MWLGVEILTPSLKDLPLKYFSLLCADRFWLSQLESMATAF